MPKHNPSSAPGTNFQVDQDDPHRLAEAYLSWRGLQAEGAWSLKYWRSDWWRWDGRRYRLLDDNDLRADVTRGIKHEFDRWAQRSAQSTPTRPVTVTKVTRAVVANVVQALVSLVLIDSSVEQPAWLGESQSRGSVFAFANGLVDLESLLAGTRAEVRPHSAEWFSPVCLACWYEPDAECPQFLAFLDQILENDPERIALVQEWFGLCLTTDTSFQKFLIGVGEGNNGKKVIAEVLIGLLGVDNVTHVPLEVFGDRFQLTPTLGKLANIASDIGDVKAEHEGHLKAFTSGDRMYFDRKSKPGLQAYPTARLTFMANTLPRFRDRSMGIWRRILLLIFRVAIPAEQQNRHLAEELKVELSGIFNWSIEGLRRLRERGRFTEPATCRQALNEYRAECNPARDFLQEDVRQNPQAHIPCKTLFGQYRMWCDENGHSGLNEKQFGKEVARVFPSVNRRRSSMGPAGLRPWVYEGIEFGQGTPTRLWTVGPTGVAVSGSS